MPVYRQLAQLLREQIASGALPVGRRIPTEQDLMQIHDLGRDSVRKGLELLRGEGLIEKVQGRGTFVIKKP